MPPPSSSLLSDDDRRELLARARQAIFETVRSATLPDFPPAVGRLAETRGAFVSLRLNGKLRCCIGQSEASHALAESVVQSAITAALGEPRVAPLRVDEMPALEIEISVLSQKWRVRPEEVQLGTHGIIVTYGQSRSLLLPQVPEEWNWSLEQFLEAACRKASLEADAWQSPATSLFAFTAEIFSDALAFSA